MTAPVRQADQCHGIKPDGTSCKARRLSNFAKASHLVTTPAWFCHRHKDQAVAG